MMGVDIPMVEAARNWVMYKAYEIEGEKKDNLLAVIGLAQKEYAELQAKNQRLRESLGNARQQVLNGTGRKTIVKDIDATLDATP